MKAVFASFVFLSMAAVGTAQNENVLLKWNLDVNQRFEYMIKLNVSGGEAIGSMSGTLHFADKVTSIKNGNYVQNVYCAGVTMTGTGLMEQATSTFADIKNLSFTRTVNPTGKSESVAGMAVSSVGGAVDLVFSDKPVGVGDTWKGSFTPNEAIGETEITYKLKSLTASEALIEGTIKNTEAVEAIAPYVFLVDRKTGRYKYASGAITANIGGQKFDMKFQMQMLVPVQPMPWGKLWGGN